MATKWLMQATHSVATVEKKIFHVSDEEQGYPRIHQAAQNGMWFKFYELLISGIFM